jgi:hypothetical protein
MMLTMAPAIFPNDYCSAVVRVIAVAGFISGSGSLGLADGCTGPEFRRLDEERRTRPKWPD